MMSALHNVRKAPLKQLILEANGTAIDWKSGIFRATDSMGGERTIPLDYVKSILRDELVKIPPAVVEHVHQGRATIGKNWSEDEAFFHVPAPYFLKVPIKPL